MRVLCLFLLTASLSACGNSSGDRPSELSMFMVARTAVKDKLRDPSSADFRNERLGSYKGRTVVCGEVNANNGFGGKSGFERYVSNGGEATALESEMTKSDFADVWRQMSC